MKEIERMNNFSNSQKVKKLIGDDAEALESKMT